MSQHIDKLIKDFDIKPTQKGERDFITGRPTDKNYSAEENASRLLESMIDKSNKIKTNYKFQNGKEFLTLLDGFSLEENLGVTYWDYIETDTLLSLQKPKTNYPDENIFIMYHQQCELYFKLIIQELERIFDLYRDKNQKKFKLIDESILLEEDETWIERLKRVVRYWDNLILSFNILKEGFSTSEFKKFRNALQPASGFQTFQLRKIELMLTEIETITIPKSNRLEDLYWQKGAIQVTDGKPSKLLQNFNDKYKERLQFTIDKMKGNTLYSLFVKHQAKNKTIRNLLIELDNHILVWKIAHKQMVYAHIPAESSATGGTDYSMYLPQFIEDKKHNPRFNRTRQVLYFPELWGKETDPHTRIKNHINYFKRKLTKTVDSTFPEDNPTGIKKTS